MRIIQLPTMKTINPKENLNNTIYLQKEILNSDEACQLLGIAKGYLYKLTHRHEIPFYRPNGKLIYFERTDLMAWMRRNRVNSAEETSAAALGYVAGNTFDA